MVTDTRLNPVGVVPLNGITVFPADLASHRHFLPPTALFSFFRKYDGVHKMSER
jgi:hypothetical protein